MVPQEAQILTSYVANKALFWLVTDVLEIAAGVSLKWDPTSITLAQIKKKIDDLQKDMNILLEADFKDAFQWLEYAASDLKNEDFESAYTYLEKVQHDSVKAYSKLKTFRKKVFCKKMTIFAKHLIKCYNKETKSFDDLLSLPHYKQKALSDSVLLDVDIILEEFNKIEEKPSLWQRKVNKAKSKSEEQDVLDGLLKAALPIIWHHHELFKVRDWDDRDMTKYLPDGNEDAAEILLEGKWPIRIWKQHKITTGNYWLAFEFQNKSEVDDKIRFSTFRSISSLCKYSKTDLITFTVNWYEINENCFEIYR